MKNLVLRILSALVIAPIFLLSLYESNYFFYFILFTILVLSFYEISKNIKQKKISFFLYFLIIFFLFSLINIRGDSHRDFILCVWILVIIWCSDIGGYIFGKIFKGPKLTRLSPNKTISGFFGSLFLSQFSILFPLFLLDGFIIKFNFFIFQVTVCIVAVIGDIFFSYIKRLNNIKDYSNLIPGHGGILDRIDGMVFAIIYYYFIFLLNVI